MKASNRYACGSEYNIVKNDRISICVIGAGRAGIVHARAIAQIPNAHLAGLVDSSEERCRKVWRELGFAPRYSTYQDAVADGSIDAVVVATPTDSHAEIVLAAAEAGKHVFCEKPMATRVSDCMEMIEATERKQVKLQIGFMRRFDSGFQQASEVIERGDIGEVVLVKSLTRGPSIPRRWHYDVDRSGGVLAEVNSHDIDTVRWFTGSEFAQVYAVAGNYRCPDVRAEFSTFYDSISLIASLDNGMQAMIDGGVSVRYGYDARVEVLGTEGVMLVGRLPEGAVAVCTGNGQIVQRVAASWQDLFAQAYVAENRAFVAAIQDDQDPLVTGRDGLMAMKVVEAGNQSVRDGRPVHLDSLAEL
jgi:predicted dehydrogenase